MFATGITNSGSGMSTAQSSSPRTMSSTLMAESSTRFASDTVAKRYPTFHLLYQVRRHVQQPRAFAHPHAEIGIWTM